MCIRDSVRCALAKRNRTPEDFAALLSPAAEPFIEEMAQCAKVEKENHFGNSVCFFTPLYICLLYTSASLHKFLFNDISDQKHFTTAEQIGDHERGKSRNENHDDSADHAGECQRKDNADQYDP